MRLLITTDAVGGVWTFTQELATGLLERECSVLLLSFGRAPSAAQMQQCESLAQRFGRGFRFVASETPLEWMDANERAFAAGAELLQREAALFAPDVIHSNQFCYGALDLAAPRVVTAHSDVLSWAKACRKEPLADTPWLRNYIAQVQQGLVGADGVTAPTRWMLHALEESFMLPVCQTVIPNGRANPATFKGARQLRAVTAGRVWDEAKGICTLNDVRSPVPIAIAGETQFDSCQRPQGVEPAQMLGPLSEAQMLDLFQHSAIYLCLSVYEPFGLAAVEAGRSGCAVIARDIPSLREVWEDGALYFGDADSLSAILQQLAREPQLLEGARRRSFERSLFFSRDRMVEQYFEVFQQVQTRSTRAEHVA